MASSSLAASLLILACILLRSISPSHSQPCTSQTLKTNFKTCINLPTLNSSLHYTYNPTNSSLSIAFVAPPAKPSGWIAWAINPTGKGMAGSQALLGFKSNNGGVIVKTYDVVSYSKVTESRLSFDVWDLSGEATGDGNLVIYGTLRVEDDVERLNQVWQVGGEVGDDGMPRMHEFLPDNLKAKGVLELKKSISTSSTPAPTSSYSSSPHEGGSSSSSSLSLIKISSLIFLSPFIITALFLC